MQRPVARAVLFAVVLAGLGLVALGLSCSEEEPPLAVSGLNHPPQLLIRSPGNPGTVPEAIPSKPTLVVKLTDPEGPDGLEFRWTFLPIQFGPHAWTEAEDSVLYTPDSLSWSDWTVYADTDTGMAISVPDSLEAGGYVLGAEARDHEGFLSEFTDDSIRRVRVCAADNEAPRVFITFPFQNDLVPITIPAIATFVVRGLDDNPAEEQMLRWAMVDIEEFDYNFDDAIDYLRKDPDILAQYGKTEADAEAEWTPWTPNEIDDWGATHIQMGPLSTGLYIFAVQAYDACGAALMELDDRYNVRRLRVSHIDSGPILTVRNPHVGPQITASCNTPMVIRSILSGIPMRFEFDANARHYGGIIVGYRYGWDIIDVNDDRQWEIDFTPFVGPVAAAPPRTFGPGTHSFHVEIRDNSGFCSRMQIKLNVLPYAPTRNLLLVDDFAADASPGAGWDDPVGKGYVPTDAEHDLFWLGMLGDVEGFNPAVDVIEVDGATTIPLATLAQYKNIVWSVYADVGQGAGPLLYQYTRYQPKDTDGVSSTAEPNPLALFMEAGGHVLIAGRHPVTTTINRLFTPTPRLPFMFLYDYEDQDHRPHPSHSEGDESFAYHHLSLETMDFAIPEAHTLRTAWYNCGVEDLRPITSTSHIDEGMREANPMDVRFPRLHLRAETADPGKAYAPDTRSYEAEVYNPMYFANYCQYTGGPRPGFEPIYGLHCLDSGAANYHQPVAFWTSAFADRVASGGVAARSAVFGFPPVYFDPSEVKAGLDLILFDEWMLPRMP